MITVSGRPFDATAMMAEYPVNSVERQVLLAMSQAEEQYRYDSTEQLRFELLLRREIVNAARDLNRSRFSFAVFYKSRCNPEYWERTENGGFQLKEGAVPSEAINDIYENGEKYATECATAMQIVYYRALLKVFQEYFNEIFPDIYLMNWRSIAPLLREVGTPVRTKTLLLGDRGYFNNPDVDPQTPELQGENVLVLPDGLYYGHGIGIGTADRFIRALNANRKEGATREAYLMESAARPNFKRLAAIYYNYARQAAG